MTNADKIRNLTDDELIKFLFHYNFDCSNECADFRRGCAQDCKHELGRDFIREWLKEEL